MTFRPGTIIKLKTLDELHSMYPTMGVTFESVARLAQGTLFTVAKNEADEFTSAGDEGEEDVFFARPGYGPLNTMDGYRMVTKDFVVAESRYPTNNGEYKKCSK